MEEETKVDLDTSTQEEEVEEETTEEKKEEETPKTLSEEEIAELKKKADLADNYKIRAEKAEKKAKQTQQKEEDTKENKEEGALSTKDVLALTGNNISAEDYDEVIRVATILDKDINEALKDPTLKTILDTRAEQRKTAEATNTKEKGKGGTKTDGESLLKKAETTGEVPQDEAGIRAVVEAEMARKKQEAK